ncbi:MAG TPA: ferrous iron transport protein B [Phycisphaerales bacterium]|nr:ferrous iron transport protein B [Phycisphaerales bacterium]
MNRYRRGADMTAGGTSTATTVAIGGHDDPRVHAPAKCFALIGNPNTGKTTLFNRLCGLRAKTANFPGSTVEARIGTLAHHHRTLHVVDLPGMYGLHLDRPESRICKRYLEGTVDFGEVPDGILIVIDATNVQRNLVLAAQALSVGKPAVVALNMIDLADRRGIKVDDAQLSQRLGCPVVRICARSGVGVHELLQRMELAGSASPANSFPDTGDVKTITAWARDVSSACVTTDKSAETRAERTTDRVDGVLTHPIWGMGVFLLVMMALFYVIFTVASFPMDMIEYLFTKLGTGVDSLMMWTDSVTGWGMSGGAIHDLLIDGVIGGVAGTLVFLPQICLLFFLISLLEDTGYLARAAFLMDRLLRKFGLPGQAFVPLLSGHACAIPAMMSTRLIADHRDRLATILVIPFMSCSARLPVYVLLISMLFEGKPWLAGLAFVGCYALGAIAALLTAKMLRKSILKGPKPAMVLELPTYKWPSLRTALLTTYDRAMMFLRKAGTVIMCICIIMWWLGAYPKTSQPPAEAVQMREQAETIAQSDAAKADELRDEADRLEARWQKRNSFAGMLGRGVEPAIKPIGMDWQLGVGVMSSFAAREVFASTMSVLLAGSEDTEDSAVVQRIKSATRDDGSRLFTTRTAASVLVFYVLAMQCLATLAVTRRETGSWWWALLQLIYMTVVAYCASWITYVGLGWFGAT